MRKYNYEIINGLKYRIRTELGESAPIKMRL